jgi:hypothetical protein
MHLIISPLCHSTFKQYVLPPGSNWFPRKIREQAILCMQNATFPAVLAKGIRLKALSEAGSRGPWSAVSELHVIGNQDT